MNNNTKQRSGGTLLYVILAVIAAVIVFLTVYTIASSRNDGGADTADTSDTADMPQSSAYRPEVTAPATSALPAITDGADTTANDTVIPGTSDPASTSAEQASALYGGIKSFVLPVHGYISKNFDLESLVYSLTMNDYRTHSGIDICATVGSPVYAAAGGTVVDIYADPLMGHCVTIEHGDGLRSHYMNLSETMPQGIVEGASVKAGQVIAGIGESAIIEVSDASHLHFEISVNGERKDPLDYIPYSESAFADASYEG